MIDLRNEPEVQDFDRTKPQILDADNHIENMHIAVGFASRCWTREGVFDTGEAIRLANELCAYVRVAEDRARSNERIYAEGCEHAKPTCPSCSAFRLAREKEWKKRVDRDRAAMPGCPRAGCVVVHLVKGHGRYHCRNANGEVWDESLKAWML